ncbi:MAG: hypothetical protein EOO64_02470 [Massilia sp.]|nr:MAG: hypothetical protein EOO64_02470 [Massilia sp.]
MRSTSKFLALALATALQPAVAAVTPISLDFEDITGSTYPDGVLELLNHYSGVEFKGASWGVANLGCDGIADFVERNGKCSGFLLAGDPSKPTPVPTPAQTATIDIASGFISGSSLYYSALVNSGVTITAFEGLDGTGRSFSSGRLQSGGCQQSNGFCDWFRLDFALGDVVAHSLVITGRDSSVMLDDLSFLPTDVTQPGALPEPAGLALSLAALGALGWARKRTVR